MSQTALNNNLYYKGLPAIIGLGLAWLGVRIIQNEKRLIIREIELKKILKENSLKSQKSFIPSH